MKSSPQESALRRNRRLRIGIPVLAALLLIPFLSVLFRRVPAPALSLEQTGMKNFDPGDFDAVHSPADPAGREYLIFGNVAHSQAPDAQAGGGAFLGRWEGYGYGPPVKRDWKYVLAIRSISPHGGSAYWWAGTDLQYPSQVMEIEFRFVPGDPAAVEWRFEEGGAEFVWRFALDPLSGLLEGWRTRTSSGEVWGPVELGRGRAFRVFRDYTAHLAEKRIRAEFYRDDWLSRYYGKGFLVYLPEGYEERPEKTWPLIFFLHGSGDRGDNPFRLAKASPLMMIREKGPLPFIIAAPLLGDSADYASFPEPYLDGALEQVLADYRVDRRRIYLTGISMGGEAAYRFARHRPEAFAAVAPLAAYLYAPEGLAAARDLPFWVIHGAEDAAVPLGMAQRAVEALVRAGADVKFTVLEGCDHDVWTRTYLDDDFYAWLLQHRRG
ncbi:MAG: dienelactone hydrolase family protein [Anaerolineales bacterium]|nr:dienelactone hydrolase family protein [Anaerolineales bacterium]